MPKKITALFIASLCLSGGSCLFMPNAQAMNNLYRVEVLVFQHLDGRHNGRDIGGERWNENPGYPQFEKAIKLLPSLSDTLPPNTRKAIERNKETKGKKTSRSSYMVPYQVIETKQLHLAGVEKKLVSSKDYRPLFLSGWMQSVERPEQARAVYLGNNINANTGVNLETERPTRHHEAPLSGEVQTLKVPDNDMVTEDMTKPDINALIRQSLSASARLRFRTVQQPDVIYTAFNRPAANDVQQGRFNFPMAEGIVRASRANYFHIDVDLAFNFPMPEATEEGLFYRDQHGRAVFRLFESRRVKTGQINYFDHPAFGVLVFMEKVSDAPTI